MIKHPWLFFALFVLLGLSSGQAASAQPAPSANTGRYQPTTVPPIPDAEYKKMTPDEQDEANEYLQVMDAENKNSFDLYGKVVDQNGQPVVGAKVRGNVLLSVSMVASASKDYFTTTDKNGEFNFTGLHGTSFGVAPSKDGYEYNQDQQENWSKSYKPDPAHPIVFVMYKLQGAEITISDDKFYGIKPDSEVYTIDLIKGKKTVGSTTDGDLHVIIQRPLAIQHNTKFDWSFSVEAIDGGLIKTSDRYLNEAPEGGYQSKVEIKISATDPQWANKFDGTFYIKSRNGKVYGKIKIEVLPIYQTESFFNMQSTVNATGSRNLEIEQDKNIKAGAPNAQLSSPKG